MCIDAGAALRGPVALGVCSDGAIKSRHASRPGSEAHQTREVREGAQLSHVEGRQTRADRISRNRHVLLAVVEFH